jgi:hypothetical protein
LRRIDAAGPFPEYSRAMSTSSARLGLLCALSLLVAASTGCGKKSQEPERGDKGASAEKAKDKGGDGDEKAEKKKTKKGDDKADEKGDDGDKPKAKAGAGCKAPDAEMKADYTIPKGCKLKLESYIAVQEGAVLTIEPGARIEFGPDSYIEVQYGKLSAKGTEDEPIVFTSTNKDPAAGDWPGLFIGSKATNGNVIDHATIEYAGRDAHGSHGGISYEGGVHEGRVTITNTKFKDIKTTAVNVESPESTFAKFEGNTFSKTGDSAIDVPSMVLGSVGKNDWGGNPIRTGGDVTANVSWPKVDVPIIVTKELPVRGAKNAAILTLADKTVVKFVPDGYIEVGLDNGSGLVAKDCTFTSANATAAPGDWPGLFFASKTTGTTIEGGTIEYAGRDAHGAHAAVTFEGTAKAITNAKVKNVTFKKNLGAAFHSDDHDCGDVGAAASGNKADGPLCTKE